MAGRFPLTPGTRLIVTPDTALNGYSHDKARVRQYLAFRTIYTLAKGREGSWRTDIALEEIPGVWFNSVNFVAATPTQTDDPAEALALWEADPSASILCLGTQYAVGHPVALATLGDAWRQTCPEELEALLAQDN